MNFGISLILLIALGFVAGLFRSGSWIVDLIVTRLVAPVLLGIAVASFCRTVRPALQVLLLVSFVAVADATRLHLFLLTLGGWRYIFADPNMEILLPTSVAFQIVAGVGAWSIARLVRSET